MTRGPIIMPAGYYKLGEVCNMLWLLYYDDSWSMQECLPINDPEHSVHGTWQGKIRRQKRDGTLDPALEAYLDRRGFLWENHPRDKFDKMYHIIQQKKEETGSCYVAHRKDYKGLTNKYIRGLYAAYHAIRTKPFRNKKDEQKFHRKRQMLLDVEFFEDYEAKNNR